MRPPFELVEVPLASPPVTRPRLVARARLLAWLSLGWHIVESVVGLVIAAVALKEGYGAWRGQGCCAEDACGC